MNKKIFSVSMIFAVLLLALLVNGCGEVPLAELRQNPEKYLGKEIVTGGWVNSTTKILNLQMLKLQDAGNQNSMLVWLQSGMSLPAEGDKILVKGIVKQGLGYYIEAIEIKNLG